MYEHVLFCNCESASTKKITGFFEFENMNTETWKKLCIRLNMKVTNKEERKKFLSGRYKVEKPRGQVFESGKDDSFDDIINHILKEKGNVDASSLFLIIK